jgi:hypothetical protein
MFRMISIIGFAAAIFGIAVCRGAFPSCGQRRIRTGPWGTFRRLVYLAALLCFSASVITGFYPTLVLKESIYGYWLILHTVFAPVFMICLTVLAIMRAENCSFKKDCPLMQKICFWLIIILAIPVILSIVLSMFWFFGTTGQESLLQLHRYSALLLAIIVIVYTYLIIRTRTG